MEACEADGRRFKTRKQFMAALQAALRSHPMNTEFGDTLADTIETYHKEAAREGLTVEKFVYIDAIRPPDFGSEPSLRKFAEGASLKKWNNVLVGFFPGVGWRDVTYQVWKTRDGSITMKRCKQDIRTALREIANGFLPRGRRRIGAPSRAAIRPRRPCNTSTTSRLLLKSRSIVSP